MKILTCFLILILAGSLVAADPAAVAKATQEWRTQHEGEIVKEFSDLLAIPNLASDTPNIRRNADAIRQILEKRGVTVQVLNLENAPPIVVGDLPNPGSTRTIAFYAHYDGQPVDASRWKSDPWKPVMRDSSGRDVDWQSATTIDPEWRLYARSAGDDKTPKQLSFDDLAKSKPFFAMDDNADAFVTRPRVSFDPAYQTFLKNNGAF